MSHYNRLGVLKSALLLGTALGLMAPLAAAAQTSAPAQTPDEAVVEEIIVTGTRASLEDALAIKRRATQVVDSISSEGIGKLPDLNLAESLQRVPGIQINRSAGRRSGTVSIRGLPGGFAQVEFNGQYLASPDVSNFAFGNVRSEVFGAIEVIKAQDAAGMTGGLSGIVNLRTGNPLSTKDQFSVSADNRYEQTTKKWSPGFSVVAAKEFVPSVLAVRGAIGYRKFDFRDDNVQINTYDRTAGAATADLQDDVYIPRQMRLATNLTKGSSYSASLGAEYKPTPSLKAELSAFYNLYNADGYTSQYLLEPRAGTVRTPLGAALNEGAFGQTYNHFRLDNPYVQADSRLEDTKTSTVATTAVLTWTHDNWTVAGTAHFTEAWRDLFTYGYVAAQAPLATGTNGYSIEVDTGAGDVRRFAYDLTPSNGRFVNLNQAFLAPVGPTYRVVNAQNTPGASFQGGFRNQHERDNERALQLDIKRELGWGPLKAIRAGASYRDKFQDQGDSLQTLFGLDLSKINNSFYDYSSFSGGQAYMGGQLSRFEMADYAELDVKKIAAILKPNPNVALPNASYIVGPGGLVAVIDSTSLSLIYDNAQKISGGYLLADIDQSLTSWLNVRGNIGVRHEQSERATQSANSPGQTLGLKYNNTLPMANLIFEFGDDVVLRSSYTETLRRPQVDSFAVVRSVAVDGTGNLVTANLGARDLKPFTSKNTDLSLEWYNRPGSSFSVLAFRKEVANYAGTTRLCPSDGGGFGFGPLSNASGVCRTTQATAAQGSFPAVLNGATVLINVTANQDTFTLSGFELSAVQNFDFLPGLWKYFGGQLNYTRVKFSTNGTFRLSEVSKNTVNAILYWETPKVGLRAAYNFRSGYFLGSGGTASGADRFVRDRSQLDLSASYTINDRLQLTAEAFNVTNKQLYEYEGAETRARNYNYYGRTFTVGARYRFQ